MTYAKQTARLEIKISPDLKKEIEKKALKAKLSLADHIRKLIEKDLNERN